MKKCEKYYVGLDMGTSSVGWAVTDENYRLIKKGKKDLWGIRAFDEANTAVERRTHRISRRRRQRQMVKIALLKDMFAEEINKVDPLFLVRLENSKFHEEDKDEILKDTNGIFSDKNYEDKDYFKEYPTIFHLRKALIHEDKEFDVRLVFLAVLNLFKHRGHFLNGGVDSDKIVGNIHDLYAELQEMLSLYTEIDSLPYVTGEEIIEILSDRETSRTYKKEALQKLFMIDKREKGKLEVVKAIVGLSVDANNLFPNLEKEEKITFSFEDFSYEEQEDELMATVGDNNAAIIDLLKEIYGVGALQKILKGYEYLSDSRVADYEKHKADLRVLKRFIKQNYDKDIYAELFRKEGKGNYSAYVNSVNSSGYAGKYRRNMSDRTMEAFYKTIKGYAKNFPENEDALYILKEIENETFMPKQLTKVNGIIPNQIHGKELSRILEKAGRYLTFLNEVDDSGLTVSERIMSLFSFHIPYYIGPVSENSKTGWVVRKEEGMVLPWNLSQKIDEEATTVRFIERLIRKCTYLNEEKVLPKASLEYEAFCVLNEINNIRIDGEKITVELKQDIYNELFMQGKKVSRKRLISYLQTRGVLSSEEQLSGIDREVNSSLSSYGKFYEIFGEKMNTDTYKGIVEEIIRMGTIFGDSKKMYRKQLVEKYGDVLDEKTLKRICSYRFKDWGRLSKEFLELQGCRRDTGEVLSLIRMMWEENANLQEILSAEKYSYQEILIQRSRAALNVLTDFSVEDLDEYYFSAPVKRMVWQTLLVIKEIQKVMGDAPEKIFIEMTRSDEEKGERGRKESRKKQLVEIYKSNVGDFKYWVEEIEKADTTGILKSKKIFLYFTQMGRCMYSGEEIDLDDLINRNDKYDIEHIYPRHFVKDDSLYNNLVLVKKELNEKKSDIFPIPADILTAQAKELWKFLRRANLITEEKYRRLTRRTPFSDEDRAGFIARQLVETSQGTKGVADILKAVMGEETTIVYSKASNVADFRKQFDIPKSRLINDFHHAHDAYLNIVVGNVYFTKFTQNPLRFIREEYSNERVHAEYNLSRMFDWNVSRGNTVAWYAPTEKYPCAVGGTIDIVRDMLKRNTPLYTKRVYEGTGALSKETIYSTKVAKENGYIPLKSLDKRLSDVMKYGGFTSAKIAYFFLVEHGMQNKRVRTIEAVPIYAKDRIEKTERGLLQFCENELKLFAPKICYPKIPLQSLIKRNGYKMRITGKTENYYWVANALPLCLGGTWIKYISELEKMKNGRKESDVITRERNLELYDILLEKHTEKIFAKRCNYVGDKLKYGRDKFLALDEYEQQICLIQILKLTAFGVEAADLKSIGGTTSTGKMRISRKITESEEFLLINQSVTGIFENEINLLTI